MTDNSKLKNDVEVKETSKVDKDTNEKHPFILTEEIIEDCLSTSIG